LYQQAQIILAENSSSNLNMKEQHSSIAS